MGFIYGVGLSSRFPLTLSLRYEDPQTLVYDDPLARSTCHLNAVPSDVHLSDWRALLRQPTKGRALLHRLKSASEAAFATCFYHDELWRESVLRPGAVATVEELFPLAIAALNAVPSQVRVGWAAFEEMGVGRLRCILAEALV